ncbi:Uncharacterised protein [Vibrio cholerae]|nr:Uncharacterised protein [Vibrio cholerae]
MSSHVTALIKARRATMLATENSLMLSISSVSSLRLLST